MKDKIFTRRVENTTQLAISWGELSTDFPLHCHDFSELVFITHGSGIHQAEGVEFKLAEGDVFVIKANQYHAFKVNNEKLTVVNVKYTPEQYSNTFQNIEHLAGFNLLFKIEPLYRKDSPFKSHLRLNKSQLNHSLSIISRLDEELAQKKEGYQTMADLLFCQLVIDISRFYSEVKTYSNNDGLNLAEVLSYINQHLYEPIRLEQLAVKANLSINHFLRLFKGATGQSPIDYILTIKLLKAKERIRNSTKPISQIAYQTGFQDSNYFSRQFKKRYGISPREFRTGRTK